MPWRRAFRIVGKSKTNILPGVQKPLWYIDGRGRCFADGAIFLEGSLEKTLQVHPTTDFVSGHPGIGILDESITILAL